MTEMSKGADAAGTPDRGIYCRGK